MSPIRNALNFFGSFDNRLWMLILGWFVAAFGFAASMPFVSVYFYRVLGLSLTEIAYFFLVMALFRAVFQAIGGEMSDRLGRVPLLIGAQVLRGITFVGMAVAIQYEASFWWVGGLLLLNSIFGSVFFPALNALVSDILPESQRLDGYAVSRAAGNLGWALGPAIGGFLAAQSYAILFHLSAVLTLISGLIFAIFLKGVTTRKNDEPFRLRDLTEVTRNRFLAWHVILTFLVYLVHLQLIVPVAVYTTDLTGVLDESGLGQLYLINGILIVLFQIPITRLLVKFRFTTQLALGSLFYLVGYGLFGMYSSFLYFALMISFVSFGEMFISPPTLTLVSKMSPEGKMGRYMGIHGFFTTLGFSLAPLYGNALLDSFSDHYDIAWMLIGSVAIIVSIGYWRFAKIIPVELDNYQDNT